MNRKLIVRMLGALLLIESAAMIPALIISFIFRDGDSKALCYSILLIASLGSILCFLPKAAPNSHLRLKEGYIITALGWILLGVCGSLPFLFSGVFTRFEDAFFETVSGLTTTGASVTTNFEDFPRGIMFWRATTHWIGGMGVLVLTLALLPKLTGRTSHLVRAESPGPSLSKLVPKTGTTAKILYKIYILLTLLEFVCLLLCGLNPYDAAVHAFATAGTGGFSNYGKSIAAFQSVPVDIVITIFMFMFGVNFALYYKFLIGERFKAFWKDEEFRWYFVIGISFMLLISLINLPYYNGDFWTSLRYGTFQISSVMSTTGFVTADFNQWPAASHVIIILAMLIGSCAGSTAGGIKVVRINMLCKLSRRNIRATGQPKKMEVVRIDGKAVDEHILSQVAQFAFMYIALVLIGGFILSLFSHYDLLTNLSASLTCVSNVGPGLGAVGPVENFAGYGIVGKITLSFLMLFGRLELLPMFILFTRSAWQKH
jgi:trk system potassium uptake protein TrkH